MKLSNTVRTFLVVAALAISASAVTITGTVKNGTTGKPAAGTEVAVLELSQGMNEIGHTKTDSNGSFSFDIDNPNVPHMVRVTHDGVNYFPESGPIRPGTTTTEVTIYDGAKKLDGVKTKVNVLRVQADNGSLQVLELIAIDNGSNPPRALSSDKTYEFYLPEGVQVDQGIAQSPGGMPINLAPVSEGKGGKYYVNYALKPGETRFEIAYHLPYSGEAAFTPKITDEIQHFVVMTPKSMSFQAKNATSFSPMNDDQANIQVATGVKPGTDLSFRVSGTGILQDDAASGQQQAQAPGAETMGGSANDSRPGGGLGAPIDAPDPLHSFRYAILTGLAIVVIAGGVFVVNRANAQQPAFVTTEAMAEPASAKPLAPSPIKVSSATPVSVEQERSNVLLEALKEELFQLEVERQQGRISQQEYEKNKAALDQTLSRALSRAKPNG